MLGFLGRIWPTCEKGLTWARIASIQGLAVLRGKEKPVAKKKTASEPGAIREANNPHAARAQRSHVTRAPLRVKVVIYADEAGGFTAEVPALPGCVTEGETRAELLANLREAIEGCLLAGSGAYQPLDASGQEEEIEL